MSRLLAPAGAAIALLLSLSVAASTAPLDNLLDGHIALARSHVEANAEALGLSAEDVGQMRLSDAYTSDHNGVTHVYFMQQLEGIDVANAMINVNVLANGSVTGIGNRFIPRLADRVTSTTRGVSAGSAIATAATFLEEPFARSLNLIETRPGASQASVFATGGATLEPIRSELVYHSLESGQLRLAWNLEIQTRRTGHLWEIRVDAVTGDVLAADDRTVSFRPESEPLSSTASSWPLAATGHPTSTLTGPSYLVFPPPAESPLHPAGVGTLQSAVMDPADPVASPYGWHDTDGAAGAEFTETRGNNVYAYRDGDGNDQPDPDGSPDGGSSLVFNFAFDQTIEPDATQANVDAAITNLFFWNNYLHDVMYGYGFTEVSGNFQANNYGLGGSAGDEVLAEGQDGGASCNANFSTPADGARPRMQLYLCGSATPSRDAILDHFVVSHVYAWGIVVRLTGGPGTVGCNDNGESPTIGWGDWMGLMMTQTANHAGSTPRGAGTYAFGQAADGPGIRPRPYSPDLAINEFTYDDIKTLPFPHGVGHVWATMLWDLTLALMGDAAFPGLPSGGNGTGGASGFNPNLFTPWNSPVAGGNNLALQLVTDGLKLQTCHPGFVDARNAILIADEALTPGADFDPLTPDGRNACALWTVFARRGLGFSSSQGSPFDKTDGTEAFDMPPSPVLNLSSQVFVGVEAMRGQSITASTVTISAGADLTLQSKTTVTIGDGFTVEQGGKLTVVIDPLNC